MNPETVPERLEEFHSILLNQKVKTVEVLPGDSTRLADEQSPLIMDILVRFEDGTYCNVEVQKIGYAFPGERCACYSSDLLLRQYKKARSEKKDRFTYKDVKGVYTIVLMEKSPAVFQKYSDNYIHTFTQQSDTGLEMDLLQKYIFIEDLAVLEQEKEKAIDLPQFEKLTGIDRLYSIRHPESKKNVRVIYAIEEDSIILLTAFLEKNSGDYQRSIEIAQKRLNWLES